MKVKVYIFIALIIVGAESQKPLKKKVKKNTKNIKALDDTTKKLDDRLKDAEAKLAVSPASRTTIGTDEIALFDATISGYTTKCGPQDVTGWVENLDVHYDKGSSTLITTSFFDPSTGVYTSPSAGWFKICGFFRFKLGGNSVDITLRKNGAVVAAFGDADQEDWRSTGTCIIEQLAVGNTLKLRLESGGGSDCIEETGWKYARFNAHLIAQDT